MGLCAAASHFSFSFFAWLPAAPKYPPIIYRLKFLIFGFPLSLSFLCLLAGCRLEVSKVPSYSIPPRISDFWFSFSFLFCLLAGCWLEVLQAPSYYIAPQISDFWFSSLSLSFLWLLAGCRLEVPRSPPILYRLKFLIFGFPLSFFPSLFAVWKPQSRHEHRDPDKCQ